METDNAKTEINYEVLVLGKRPANAGYTNQRLIYKYKMAGFKLTSLKPHIALFN
jgi:hypothetical protein